MTGRRFVVIALTAGLLITLAACKTPRHMRGERPGQGSRAMSMGMQEAMERVFPCLVRIDARKEVYKGGRKDRSGGTGSGTIFDSRGYILTNYHVAGEATELKVTLFNKEKVSARLVGADSWTDLAVLQLNMDEVRESGIMRLPYAKFGSSAEVRVGQTVLAMGTPYGLSRSVSKGIVGNRERFLGSKMMLPGGKETGVFNNWIQTDARILPGNSGGPLVNMRGEVIGVNSRGLRGGSLGFAIPIDIAREVIHHILNLKPRGQVVRSWLGLQFQKTQNLEKHFKTRKNVGVLIALVEKGSPAEAAGLRSGDMLVEINSLPVSARFDEEISYIRKMIADLGVGEDVDLMVLRKHGEKVFTATTARLGKSIGEEDEIKEWGFSVIAITERMARKKKYPDTSGVYVKGVTPNEAAAKARLNSRDVITHIGGVEVKDLPSFKLLVRKMLDQGKKKVLLKVRRGKAVNFVLIKTK